MTAFTCGKKGASIGPAISSSRSSVTFTTTVEPLKHQQALAEYYFNSTYH